MPADTAGYRFGPFLLDTVAFRLSKAGAAVQLSPKIVDLLHYLIARPSTLVTKEELFGALWPDVSVTDNALTQAVSDLRQALGDDPGSPTYIQTVARRGYRFVAPVESVMLTREDGAPALAPRRDRAWRAIAVTDFVNLSGDAEYAWLGTGIAETVTNDLREIRALRVIDRLVVAEALRAAGGSVAALRQEGLADLAVSGSFQRAGDRLRITARVVDIMTGEALADAKADGLLSDLFELQDRLVARFAAGLGLVIGTSGERRVGGRETSSLEAYEAFTEGRVKLESLDGTQVDTAIAAFERAIALDSRYALAEVGLGNAWFWRYETTRARNQPDASTLASAVDHARRAIELDKGLAEAHATLSFLLMSAGRCREALGSARHAVSLEPTYWGNLFRLGHAAWGAERLRALERAVELYPDFPFAHFEMAMVHIARGALDRAEPLLREGAIVQDRQRGRRQRFPACGLHWLLGLTRLARGDTTEALVEFEREIACGGEGIYVAEFAMNAWDGLGFARLAEKRPDEAAAMFERALEHFPRHARSLLGLAEASRVAGRVADGERLAERAREAGAELARGGRPVEAALTRAFECATFGRTAQAIEALEQLLAETDPPFAGWTIPIEPLLVPLHGESGFARVLARLAVRAH